MRFLEYLKEKIINWCLSKKEFYLGELHELNNPEQVLIHDDDTGDLKFIEQTTPSKFLVKTNTGYSHIKKTLKTVPMETWRVSLNDGNWLLCAEEHILIDHLGKRIFAKDLNAGVDIIKTENGNIPVASVEKLNKPAVHMYDLELDDNDHVYYTNKILSHNSWTSAAFLLWTAMFNFDRTILIASNKNDNAMEMIHHCKFMYERMPKWLKPGISDDYSKHSIGFDNGSRIISTATTENSGRGLSISLLFLDEFAFVRSSVQQEFWTSISPTLATGGAAIICSTPNGDSNIFAMLWKGAKMGNNGFNAIQVRWDEPPGRDEEFKRREIGKIGELLWNREYECQFLSSDKVLIDSFILNNLSARCEKIKSVGIMGNIKFFKEPEEGKTYLIGVDPATGIGGDFASFEVLSFPDMEQVAEYRSNTTSTGDLYDDFKQLLRLYDRNNCQVYFSIENNGIGEGLMTLFTNDEDIPECAELISEEGKKRLGMTTTQRAKLKAALQLKDMIEKDRIIINSPVFVEELKHYARKKNSFAASPGATDDSISAMLIIVRILEEISTFEEEAWELLYSTKSSKDAASYATYEEDDDEPLPMVF